MGEPATPGGDQPTVLVVDDVPFIRGLLRAMLESGGFRVVGEAGDGQAALDAYQRLRPQLMILDLVMPGVDGMAVLERLRWTDAGVRVIVCSAMARREQVLEARRLGACDFVAKPVERGRLLAAAARALSMVREPAGPEG